MIREKSFDTGRITLNYAEMGTPQKPTLMLLHGGSARWQYLMSVMHDLARDYHIIAPDLRGHGRSDNVANAYRMADFADDVTHFVRHLARPVMLFGHSLGGQVAIMASARVPDRINALIIGDAPLKLENFRKLFARDEKMLKLWITLSGKPIASIINGLKNMPIPSGDGQNTRPAREVFGEDSLWFPEMAESLSQHDPTMLSMRLNNFDLTHQGFDMAQLLPQITCPTLLLQADPEHGGLMSDDEVKDAKALLPEPHHVQLQGIGHGLFTENHDVCMTAIRAFLSSLSV